MCELKVTNRSNTRMKAALTTVSGGTMAHFKIFPIPLKIFFFFGIENITTQVFNGLCHLGGR